MEGLVVLIEPHIPNWNDGRPAYLLMAIEGSSLHWAGA